MKKGIRPLKWQSEKKMRLANRSVGLKPRSASTKAFQAKSKPPVLRVVMIVFDNSNVNSLGKF